jgi:chorismate dehydratase
VALRISLVHYLNAAPLGWQFSNGSADPRIHVMPASPSKCADQLAAGDADVGLIPSIEYQRIPDLRVIPGVCIGATREVRSVLLIRKFGAGPIRRVALDVSSRTSVALLKLLLRKRFELDPEFVPHAPDPDAMLEECDSALIIGDAALRCNSDRYEMLDLAAAWREWQGLPFVFAFWACRPKSAAEPGIIEIFQAARDWGIARLPQIAEEYSCKLSLPKEFLEYYLRNNLDHQMSAEHRAGLERFYQLAYQSGIIPELKPVRLIGDER